VIAKLDAMFTEELSPDMDTTVWRQKQFLRLLYQECLIPGRFTSISGRT
jgi:hypothetical protein